MGKKAPQFNGTTRRRQLSRSGPGTEAAHRHYHSGTQCSLSYGQHGVVLSSFNRDCQFGFTVTHIVGCSLRRSGKFLMPWRHAAIVWFGD